MGAARTLLLGSAATAATLALAAVALPAGPRQPAPAPAPDAVPETAPALRPTRVVSPFGGVVTASPEATAAAVRILEEGGNAVDAAVAAALALTCSEPGASGIGGQTWIVLRMASGVERAIYARPRVPFRAESEDGRAAQQGAELRGARAVAAPTTVATLDRALRRYGTMSFRQVIGPAIEVAESGYAIQPFERSAVEDSRLRVAGSDVLRERYLGGTPGPDGSPEPSPVGTCVLLPDLAATLRRLAEAGPGDFYTGEIASRLAEEVSAEGGFLEAADLRQAPGSVIETLPVRGSYRGRTVLSVPPPGGGVLLVAALQILEALPAQLLALPGTDRGHAVVEAVRLARAGVVPADYEPELDGAGLLRPVWLTPEWAAAQAERIRPDRSLTPAELSGDVVWQEKGTTQVSVVDAAGNAVSLTQTLGGYFGSGWIPRGLGFVTNAFVQPIRPSVAGAAPAAGGKGGEAAALSPVAPFLLLEGGRPALVGGSGGSSRITSVLAGVVVDLVATGRGVAAAVGTPRVLWDDDGGEAGPRVLLETLAPLSPATEAALRARGHDRMFVLAAPGRDSGAFGGVNAVGWEPREAAWVSVGDARRDGAAAAPRPAVRPGAGAKAPPPARRQRESSS